VEDRLFQDIIGDEVLNLRAQRSASVAIALTSLVTIISAGPAFAGTGTGGGVGGCTDSGNTVSCGTGVPGDPGSGSGTGGGPAPMTGGATTVSTPACPNFVLYSTVFPGSEGGPPPAGVTPPGTWYVNLCATGNAITQGLGVAWFATGQAPTVPPPDPAVVGAQAASELQLPSPSPTLSPSTKGYANLAEWYWIAPSTWHRFTTSAQACNAGGCVTATASATPAYVTWSTGDGSTVTCNGPGTAYNPALGASGQSTNCSHTYTTTSAGQPTPDGNPNDAAFPITATVTWTVAWSGPDGSAGALPSLTTSASTSLVVAQIESVNK
jgi:hypothetical protein